MPEIGASLREARMRAKLDITEVEADTKIRGKYLRALENEEWSLLPGATFVRSFLRTYGDYLGIDGRMLVEEFKLRHGGYDDRDLPPLGAPRSASRDRARRNAPRRRPTAEGRGRALLVAGLVALLVIGLFALGTCGSSDKPRVTKLPTTTTSTRQVPAAAVTLRILGRPSVSACLRAPDGRRLLDGVVITTAKPSRTYRGSQLRLTLGKGGAVLVVNGKSLKVAKSSGPRGYVITSSGARPVPAAERVSCP